MALSSTTSFTLDVYKSIESAIKFSKGNPSDMEDISNALVCSNLVLQEWSTTGINLWKVEQISIPLSTSTTFTLPSDVLDVLTFSIRTSTSGEVRDWPLERKSTVDYSQITNKQSEGTPTFTFPKGNMILTLLVFGQYLIQILLTQGLLLLLKSSMMLQVMGKISIFQHDSSQPYNPIELLSRPYEL